MHTHAEKKRERTRKDQYYYEVDQETQRMRERGEIPREAVKRQYDKKERGEFLQRSGKERGKKKS